MHFEHFNFNFGKLVCLLRDCNQFYEEGYLKISTRKGPIFLIFWYNEILLGKHA